METAELCCAGADTISEGALPIVPGDPAPYRRAGDLERERLILEQMPQVHFIARSIHRRLPPQVPLEDLVSAGALGLLDAVDKYDPARNVQLKSYAQFRIRGAILDSLRAVDWSSRDLRRRARRLQQARAEFQAEFLHNPEQGELAARLQMSLAELHRLQSELKGLEMESLDAPLGDDWEDAQPSVEQLPAPGATPLESCLRARASAELRRAMDQLPFRQREALRLYYFEDLSMKEVGVRLGVGESRISQLHSAALTRLGTLLRPHQKRRQRPRRQHPRPAPRERGSLFMAPAARGIGGPPVMTQVLHATPGFAESGPTPA